MSEYITTYTGKHFWPLEPDPQKLCIEDIAHALSLICRGNGHVSTFFSVGQHSLFCAREAVERGYSDKVILACLLHDASECYLSDVPRPVKAEMPEYQRIEERLEKLVYQTFLGEPLTEAEEAMVREVDDALLYMDIRELLGEVPQGPAPSLHIRVSYSFVPFAEVEREFLEYYNRYTFKQEKATVSLEGLVASLEEATEGFDTFLNIYSGELVSIPRVTNVILEPGPEEEKIRSLAASTGEYVLLPGVEQIDEKNIMLTFAEDIPNPRDAVYVRASLIKAHPKRHFRAALEETGYMASYKDYLRERLGEIARQWCEKQEIPYGA